MPDVWGKWSSCISKFDCVLRAMEERNVYKRCDICLKLVMRKHFKSHVDTHRRSEVPPNCFKCKNCGNKLQCVFDNALHRDW